MAGMRQARHLPERFGAVAGSRVARTTFRFVEKSKRGRFWPDHLPFFGPVSSILSLKSNIGSGFVSGGRSDLRDANLNNVLLGGAIFVRTDLRGARGFYQRDGGPPAVFRDCLGEEYVLQQLSNR